MFGLLLAAIVHDIAHPGLTNDFLAKTNDPLAAAHGSASVNERHHLATAFSIAANDDTNMFSGLAPAEEEQVHIVLALAFHVHSLNLGHIAALRSSRPTFRYLLLGSIATYSAVTNCSCAGAGARICAQRGAVHRHGAAQQTL